MERPARQFGRDMSVERDDKDLPGRRISEALVPNNEPSKDLLTLDNGYPRGYGYGYGDLIEEEDYGNPVLPKLIRAVRRGKWLILGLTIFSFLAFGFYAYRMRPTFTASTIVEIGPDSSASASPHSDSADPENSVNINTKILMFSGRPLLENVVTKLDLNYNKEFLDISPSRPLSEMATIVLRRISPSSVPVPTARSDKQENPGPTVTTPADVTTQVQGHYIEDPKLDRFVSILEKNMKIDHIQNTEALKISFTHPNAVIASNVANGLAEVFIDRSYQNKIYKYADTSGWLRQTTQDLKNKVQNAEQALADYGREHNIYSGEGAASLATTKLLRLHDEELRTQMDLQVKQSLYQEVLAGHVTELPQAFSDPGAADLQRQIGELSVKEAQLNVSYGPDNPNLQEVKEQLVKLREELGASRTSLAAKIKSDYERAESDHKAIAVALDQAKSEAAQQDQASIQYNILKQDVDTARSLYNEFLQKTSQTKLEEAQQRNNIEIIRPAPIPKSPDGPDRDVLLIMGPLVGMVAGIGLAFVREQLDKTVRTSADVTRFTQLPMLGAIPAIATSDRKRRISANHQENRELVRITDEETSKGTPEKSLGGFPIYSSGSASLSSATRKPPTYDSRMLSSYLAAAESYRALRTSLLLSSAGSPPKILVFASGQAGEGKTTTTINTGISLALQGATVLIIDADLRKPSIGKSGAVKCAPGLSNALSETTEMEPLIRDLGIKGLSILPCGPNPPNPSELLGSEKMRSVLADLSVRYDHILIDTAPILYVTDAVVLSTMSDGVVLVVHSGKSGRDEVSRSIDMLNGVGAKILGVVLNNVDMRHSPYEDMGPYGYYPSHEWKGDEDKLSDILH